MTRIVAPNLKTLSPLMTERRGWLRFAALEADLDGLRKAAKTRGCTVNDAFLTAVAHDSLCTINGTANPSTDCGPPSPLISASRATHRSATG